MSSATQSVKKSICFDNFAREEMTKKHQTSSLLSLTEDVLLVCLAYISRLYYPALALVSERFRNLLASPMLYEQRSLLGRTESVLYVGLMFPSDPNPQWFTLSRKSDRASKKKKKTSLSGGYVLAKVSIPQSPPMHSLGLVAVGSDIYNIGGPIEKGKPHSSRVSVLDCRTNTWSEGPRMKVERYYPSCNALDNKIYVSGGCGNGNTSEWMEVFGTKTKTWEFVANPFEDRCENKIFHSAVMDGEICIFGHWGVSYTPKEDRWDKVGRLVNSTFGWMKCSYCVIDDILYSYNETDGFQWYDIKLGRRSTKLEGLKGLPKFADYSCVKLADYGGKMVVLWDRYMRSSKYENKMIWCAVITLERHNTMEMYGEVESLDPVLTVPKSYDFVCALSATL